MKKRIFFSLAAIAFFANCNSVAHVDKRKEIITEFIAAVKTNDTNKLYKIIDTFAYFEIQDKEHLFFQVRFLQNKFIECGNHVGDSTIKISHRDIPFTDYTYYFCRGKENEFEIRFTFSDFENKNKINFIDLKYTFQHTTPTLPTQ